MTDTLTVVPEVEKADPAKVAVQQAEAQKQIKEALDKPSPIGKELAQAARAIKKEEKERKAAEKAKEKPQLTLVSEDTPAVAEEPVPAKDSEGKWHRPDGQFASEPEAAEYEKAVAGATIPEPKSVAKATDTVPKPTVEPPKPVEVFTLKGEIERGEADMELEVDDPEVAVRLKRALKEGVRRDVLNKERAKLDATAAEYEYAEVLSRTQPLAFINHLLKSQPSQRLDLATDLLIEHWDELIPMIQAFATDPKDMQITAAKREAARERLGNETEKTLAGKRAAAQMRSVIREMIPDSADPDDAERFETDAYTDINSYLSRSNGQGSLADLDKILAPRRRLYGYTPEPVAEKVSQPSVTPAVAVAAPTGADAQKLVERARIEGQRLRMRLAQRAAAAAVPTAGAGAPAVHDEPPPEAMESFKSMGKWIKSRAAAG